MPNLVWQPARRPAPSRGLAARDDPDRAAVAGQLVELRVDAAHRILAVLVGPLDLNRAHRQRLAHRAHAAEAVAAPGRALEDVEIDVGGEDLLRAADVRAPERLVGVEEGAGLLEAPRRVHHLLAHDAAAAALHLLGALHHGKRLADAGHRQSLPRASVARTRSMAASTSAGLAATASARPCSPPSTRKYVTRQVRIPSAAGPWMSSRTRSPTNMAFCGSTPTASS